MKTILFLIFAIAFSINLRDAEFISFQKEFGKTYSAPEEARYRLAVFKKNLQKIEEHNAKNLPWTLGVNKFADLAEEEFTFKFCGCAKDPKSRAGRVTPLNGVAPESVDWREKGAVTPVKDQKKCGSCWSFSITGTVEGAYFIKTGELVSLSEQQLIACAKQPDYQAFGCSGGWPYSAIDYVSDHGLCTEEDYPYFAVDQPSCDPCTVAVKTTGKVQLPQGDEESLALAVSTTPVSVILDSDALQLYKSGIITQCRDKINHAVLIVGYGVDDASGTKYWIVKNSWGADWGEKGYVRIEKETGGMGRCGIASNSVYATF